MLCPKCGTNVGDRIGLCRDCKEREAEQKRRASVLEGERTAKRDTGTLRADTLRGEFDPDDEDFQGTGNTDADGIPFAWKLMFGVLLFGMLAVWTLAFVFTSPKKFKVRKATLPQAVQSKVDNSSPAADSQDSLNGYVSINGSVKYFNRAMLEWAPEKNSLLVRFSFDDSQNVYSSNS